MTLSTSDPRDVPVLLLAFNRPDATAAVLERIRELRPRRLLVSIDGPRPDVASDLDNCLAVQEVASRIDWECTVSRRVATTNAGCRYGPAQGIDWAFHIVDEMVILEDDCLPDLSFFHFCSDLLDRFRDTPQVMSIGGHRWEGPDIRDGNSYYFSRYPSTWGWATWADRWNGFDVDMTEWNTVRPGSWLEETLKDPRYVNYWRWIFDSMIQGLDAWDYAWLYACWRQGNLTIRPNVNMVTNIGFGAEATHTHQFGHPASRSASRMPFPLQHPEGIEPDQETERLLEWVNFSGVLARRIHEGARRIRDRRVAHD